jgi:hypothetical protein
MCSGPQIRVPVGFQVTITSFNRGEGSQGIAIARELSLPAVTYERKMDEWKELRAKG